LKKDSSWSQKLHKKGVPLLISPELLRRGGLGQMGISFFEKKIKHSF
jgi:hypothetical protein